MLEIYEKFFKCDCCTDNKYCKYKTKKSAIKREAKCCFNPENKTCITCKYSYLVKDEISNVRLYFCVLACNKYPFVFRDCKYHEFNGNKPSSIKYNDTPDNLPYMSFSSIVEDYRTEQFIKYNTDQGIVFLPLNHLNISGIIESNSYRVYKPYDYFVVIE